MKPPRWPASKTSKLATETERAVDDDTLSPAEMLALGRACNRLAIPFHPEHGIVVCPSNGAAIMELFRAYMEELR